jgi:competence protein ComEC
MFLHQKIPFLRITIGLLCGILIEQQICPGLSCWLILSICCGFFSLLYAKSPSITRWRIRYAMGLNMVILLTCLGGLSAIIQQKTYLTAAAPVESNVQLVQLKGGPSKTKSGSRYTAESYDAAGDRKKRTGMVFLYLTGKQHNQFKTGDLLLVGNRPQTIKPSKNPYGFDFHQFARRKGIAVTLHGDTDLTVVHLGNAAGWLDKITQGLQTFLLDALKKNIPDQTLCGLAEAMLTGYRNDLDRTLLKAYTDTGVVHIIAISGLHLGLIFGLADLFLRKSVPKRYVPAIGFLVILPMLWVFAVMTGSSASVLRSVIMFTILLLGNALGKRNTSMNGLLASATLLLLFDPNMVWDIGFQLSYAAVASILIFEKPIRKLLYLRNKLAVYCWSMISITLSAQVLTTPFVLLHFHRFPLLFLFSNLVAVPLSSIILILEIILCLAHGAHFGGAAIGALVTALLKGMNSYVLTMNGIEFNRIEAIHISLPLMLLHVILVFFICSFLCKPSQSSLKLGLLFLMAVPIFKLVENRRQQERKEWIILPVSGASCLVHRHGDYAAIVIKTNNPKDLPEVVDDCRQALEAMGIRKTVWSKLPETPSAIMIPVRVDGQNTFISLASGLKAIPFQAKTDALQAPHAFVADGSNKLWKIREWQKRSQELHLRFLSTPYDGALTMNCQHPP